MMKSIRYAVLTISLLVWGNGCQAVAAVPAESSKLIIWDDTNLQAVKQKIRQGDEFFNRAFGLLRQRGEDALKTTPFSVINKSQIPPSGDKHDYMSLAPYWWPNPDTENGLPYIQKDGQRNPATRDEHTDRRQLGEMCDAVEILSLCYYFTDNPEYARHAAMLMRTWFLDEETRMNPNLNYAQAVPGLSIGRCYGVIETAHMIPLVDCAEVLRRSSYWTQKDHEELQQWFRQYIQWLTTSPQAIEESRTRNNHSTWYDAQATVFALYVGDTPLAKTILQQVISKDIQAKIEPDGSQPKELVRTKAYGYSLMNLRGTFMLACLGEHVGVDLWNYESDDGRSLKKALEFLIPYADSKNQWPYQQIAPLDAAGLYPLLKQAHVKIRGFDAEATLKKLPEQSVLERNDVLLYP